jgi:hypothetical protein
MMTQSVICIGTELLRVRRVCWGVLPSEGDTAIELHVIAETCNWSIPRRRPYWQCREGTRGGFVPKGATRSSLWMQQSHKRPQRTHSAMKASRGRERGEVVELDGRRQRRRVLQALHTPQAVERHAVER